MEVRVLEHGTGSERRPGFPWQQANGLSIGFCIIAENKLCGKHKFMILTRFIQQYNLYECTLLLWFLRQNGIPLGLLVVSHLAYCDAMKVFHFKHDKANTLKQFYLQILHLHAQNNTQILPF